MFDLEPIFQFSRNNCVAICSFLIPANLVTTIGILFLSATGQSLTQLRWSVAIAAIFAISLFLHVSTWFMIGVITPVTFILLALGTSCLLINVLAIIYRRELCQLLTFAKSSVLAMTNR